MTSIHKCWKYYLRCFNISNQKLYPDRFSTGILNPPVVVDYVRVVASYEKIEAKFVNLKLFT
jgi:hypothetical protein